MHTTRRSSSSAVLFAALIGMLAAFSQAYAQNPSPEKERELIAILRSDAPKADKALACKQLAVDGSDEAVPELARLLDDEQLASWARIPLEVIPGPAADEALRNALDSLQGKLLVGAINSIGVRRDELAVESLTAHLHGQDTEAASYAAVALGDIGNAAAATSLRESLPHAPAKVRSAIAEGMVLCAERLLVEGHAVDAVEMLYDEVRKADVPKQRKLEATRGAILSRKQQGIPLLIEQVQSSDKAFFQLALSTFREFPGSEVDKALAAELPKAPPERAALLIQAMADRKDTVVLPAVLTAAGEGPKEVRLAAIGALGRVGDASCVSPLLEIATESDPDLAQTAKAALADLPGEKVDQEIVARLPKAEGKAYPVLIELVGERRIAAVDELVKALDHADQTVRSAAFVALGETAQAKDLSVLISQVVAPKHADDAPVARQALRAASIRMPDREACAQELAAAIEQSPVPTKIALLEILGEVGGTKALETVAAAAKSSEPELQDVSSRLLGKWMTIDAAPVLLDLAQAGPRDKYQVRALRGYLRIARQFVMSEQQRVEMCRSALKAAHQPAEQKLVLDVLKSHPSVETLKLAVEVAREVPDLKPEANQAALAIAQKLGDKPDEVREILSKADLEKVKLEVVKAEYGDRTTIKDVTAAVQKQAADRQLILLPSSSYNETFGGDPLPGAAKQLKIQYRINGKAGEASFAENALIVLPMP